MMTGSSPWMSYLEEENFRQPASSDSNNGFFWSPETSQTVPSAYLATPFSVENGNSKGELEESDKLNPRKRSFGIGGNKACREKKRRDKLNDRFMDLSAVLDPEKPPKSDKGAILSDAVRAVSLLRVEAEQLKDLNDQLRDAINGLKAEKNELRDEKLRLKVDKARLEQKMEAVAWSVANKNMGMQGGFHQDMAMLPWLPSMALLDTSEDHILHPPVA